MTVQGAERLKAELHRLKTVERPTVIQAIADARAHGDLSENADYDAAKERQGFIEGRIAEVEGKLANAQVIDPAALDTTVVPRLAFPSGLYDFVASEAGDCGLIATCSLFSPMHDFTDHEAAQVAALAAADALFEPDTPAAPVEPPPAPTYSRRKLLGG